MIRTWIRRLLKREPLSPRERVIRLYRANYLEPLIDSKRIAFRMDMYLEAAKRAHYEGDERAYQLNKRAVDRCLKLMRRVHELQLEALSR